MKFPLEDSDLVAQFKDGPKVAPDQLIGAMLAFSPEQVVAVSTRTAEDAYKWMLLGITSSGLAVVTGVATHNPQETNFPTVTDIAAAWTPVAAIEGVQLREVRESADYYNRATEVAIDATWSIELEGQASLELPEDPTNREGAVLELARALLAKRQQV